MRVRTALGVVAAMASTAMVADWAAPIRVAGAAPVQDASVAGAPTFTKDVAPILHARCAGCHRPGDIGPMPLLSYAEARPHARAIKQAVRGGKMPPWHADAVAGVFENDRRLTPAEIETIVAWVDGGARQGDAADLPPSPAFPGGWTMGEPDAVMTMAEDYPIPASGEIDYQYFEIPTNFAEDTWIQGFEVRPGTPAVVHHVLVYSRAPEAERRPGAYRQPKEQLETPEGETGNNAVQRGPNPRPAPRRLGALIAAVAPGQFSRRFQPGTGIRIKAGSVLTFQMHYTAMGKATTDRSRIGLHVADAPVTTELRVSPVVNTALVIPAGARNHTVVADATFELPVTLYSLLPHTHLRGIAWEYRVRYPDGRSEVVLSVPKYDFNWQTDYVFAKPLQLPKGTTLQAVATYDNSPANRANPDPKVDVRWGDQTWEEMCYTSLTYAVAADAGTKSREP